MSDLRELQSLHVKLIGMLIDWAYYHGYELTWGQTLRMPVEAEANAESGAGIVNSLHLIKLAADLSLFKNGVLLTEILDYEPLGTYWKSLNPLCCWGGDFASPDADHFSITWQGVK
jgi:hypothetical protein